MLKAVVFAPCSIKTVVTAPCAEIGASSSPRGSSRLEAVFFASCSRDHCVVLEIVAFEAVALVVAPASRRRTFGAASLSVERSVWPAVNVALWLRGPRGPLESSVRWQSGLTSWQSGRRRASDVEIVASCSRPYFFAPCSIMADVIASCAEIGRVVPDGAFSACSNR